MAYSSLYFPPLDDSDGANFLRQQLYESSAKVETLSGCLDNATNYNIDSQEEKEKIQKRYDDVVTKNSSNFQPKQSPAECKSGIDDEENKRKLFVGGISDLQEADLWKYFSSFGRVVGVHIFETYCTRQNAGHGFVQFATFEEREKALNCKFHNIKDKIRTVKPYKNTEKKKIFVTFVNGLHNDQIGTHFEQFGQVDTVERPGSNFAFVIFADQESCQKALAIPQQNFENEKEKRMLRVERFVPKDQRPAKPRVPPLYSQQFRPRLVYHVSTGIRQQSIPNIDFSVMPPQQQRPMQMFQFPGQQQQRFVAPLQFPAPFRPPLPPHSIGPKPCNRCVRPGDYSPPR